MPVSTAGQQTMYESSSYVPSTDSFAKSSPTATNPSFMVKEASDQESDSSEKAIDGVDNNDNDEYPSGIRLLIVIVALVLAMLPTVMDLTILATAIPRITDEFHSLNDVE